MTLIKRIILVIALLPSTLMAEENPYVLGFGIGEMQNGLGVGFGKVIADSILYSSLGCRSYSSALGWQCGVGASYSKNIPWGKPDRHAIQLTYSYVNLADDDDDNGYESNDEKKWRHKTTVGYLYFFDGMKNDSGHIGFNLIGNGFSIDWGYLWSIK